MLRPIHSFVFAAALVAASIPSPRAEEGGADPGIRSTITSPIDAFKAGDAAKAESFASPGIKTLFPEPGAFLGMVKQSYAPLINPRSMHFEPTASSGSGKIQHVTIVDSGGVVWTAVYTLEEIDGHWAISGCVLVKSPETSA